MVKRNYNNYISRKLMKIHRDISTHQISVEDMNAKSALALRNEQSPEVILDEEEAIKKERVTFVNMHLPKSSRI